MTEPVLLGGLLVGLAVLAWPGPRRASEPSGWTPPPADPAVRSGDPLTTEDVASSMVLLALALQSGCGVVEAIEQVAMGSPGRGGPDLSTVAAALRWGVPERAAWATVDPAWGRAGQAMRLATRAGVGPSGLLIQGAGDMRAGEMARLDVDGARVAVRMVLPLGLTFLPAFCLTSVIPIVIALARQVLAT